MTDQQDDGKPQDPFKPYKGRFETYDRIPEKGRKTDDILEEIALMAEEENTAWRTGKISGTYYHAGDAHRAFLNQTFSYFSHVNTIQFDLCPSMAKFESEIISMTAGMLNGDAVKDVDPSDDVCGTVTSGGSESIAMAVKVYR